MTLAQCSPPALTGGPASEKPRVQRHRSRNGIRHPNAAFRAPVSIVEAVQAEAARRGVTFSEMARGILEEWVAALANGREMAARQSERAA